MNERRSNKPTKYQWGQEAVKKRRLDSFAAGNARRKGLTPVERPASWRCNVQLGFSGSETRKALQARGSFGAGLRDRTAAQVELARVDLERRFGPLRLVSVTFEAVHKGTHYFRWEFAPV